MENILLKKEKVYHFLILYTNVKDFDLTFGYKQNVQELDLSNFRISVKSD